MASRQEIIDCIKNAGVVGAGGAGFPTHIKVNTQVEYVIANGAECEPLLQVDQQLMEYYPEKIVTGLKLVIKATNAKKGFIALKEKYKSAIKSLKSVIKKEKNIELKFLKNYYPAGDEQSLVYAVLGRVVPEAGIPLNVDAVVNNVGTLYNIANAYEGKPVIDRYITITGAVEKPLTLNVAIGTPIKELIGLTGRVTVKDFVVINGGPMMGKIVDLDNEYVTKTTTGIIVLPEGHYIAKKKTENIVRSIKLSKTLCIQCNTCTENCPRHNLGHNIKPHIIMRKIGFKAQEIDESFADAYLCCECGICVFYACPMNLAPLKVIQFIKSELIRKKIKSTKLNQKPQPSSIYNHKRIPTGKLVKRLNLEEYERKAYLVAQRYEPDKVRIPLLQHIGIKPVPIKKVGTKVNKGELIADISDGEISAKIHSSITGEITNITDDFIEISKK